MPIPGIIASGVIEQITAAYESIASATPNNTSVTFDNIPQTYKHLQVRILGRRNVAANNSDIFMTLNNVSSGTLYDFHFLTGDGSSATAGNQTSANFIGIEEAITGDSATASIFGVGIIDIHDYSDATKNTTVRTFVGNDRNGAGNASLTSALFRSTDAITRIDFGTITYVNGTQFALYGIKGA
jgi:hypothetical protein